MRNLYTLALVAAVANCLPASAQNIGINTTGATPAASAMLDIASTDRGLLIPRVNLTARNAAGPVASPAASLMVYNNATAGSGANEVTPGYYYWTGTEWLRLFNGKEAWSTTGNYGTTTTNNFLGTIDNVALRIKTNNLDRFDVTAGGALQSFGDGTAAAPIYSWNASQGMGLFRQGNNVIGVSTGGTERVRFPNAHQIQLVNAGTPAIPSYSWTTSANAGLYSPAANTIGFSTTSAERMRIDASGRVGIGGTPANGAALDVQSTNRGVIMPRVALSALNNANPVGAANVVNGLMVYNTNTAGTFPNDVYPGYYHWQAGRWQRAVDKAIEVWYYPPTTISAFTRVTITGTIPGMTNVTAASVSIIGDWPSAPNVVIEHVEARTGAIRWVVNNPSSTTYTGMDFLITTIEP